MTEEFENFKVMGETITAPITAKEAIKALFKRKYALNILLMIILLLVIGAVSLLGVFFYKQASILAQDHQAIGEIVQYLNKNLPAKQ